VPPVDHPAPRDSAMMTNDAHMTAI